MNYQAILLFGAPGSGKGTQGQMVGRIPGFLHISTGDLFRSLDKDSETGRIFAQYANKGLLVPDDVTVGLLKSHLEKTVCSGAFDPKKHIVILDGAPRNVNQARLLKEMIDVRKIIYLKAANVDRMVERLKNRALSSGRVDDADEQVIRHRMTVYANETAPVLACYDKDLICCIEADQSIIRVFSEVVNALVPVKEALEQQS